MYGVDRVLLNTVKLIQVGSSAYVRVSVISDWYDINVAVCEGLVMSP